MEWQKIYYSLILPLVLRLQFLPTAKTDEHVLMVERYIAKPEANAEQTFTERAVEALAMSRLEADFSFFYEFFKFSLNMRLPCK